jgi:UDP-N-acetylmuramoyl-tripeptide--D-alanyl-D-alanine ligase
MFLLLSTLWLIITVKYVLFWIYLWQLKEYFLPRIIDHFRTYKGKKILFSYVQIAKIILLFLFLLFGNLFYFLFSMLFLVYLAETVLFLKSIINKTVKKPVITFKTLLLFTTSFALVVSFLIWVSTRIIDISWQPVCLLIFDILIPLVVCSVVYLFQPFFVLFRNINSNRAQRKIKRIKVNNKLIVIGITGSYGKTSTKEFLATILSKKFKVAKTKEHQNGEMGITRCVLNDLREDHQIFVVEMGSYTKNGIRLLCNIVGPEIGIVAGVNEQHLSLFKSLDNLLSAEGGRELAEALPKTGLLVLNGDNKYCLDLYKKTNNDIEKKIYTLNKNTINSNIWTEDITVTENYISFLAIDKFGQLAHFKVNVLGKQNIQNLLAAILVATELGMTFGEIAESCEDIKEVQAGMIKKNGKYGIKIIDSSYSANPDGVLADLDYLKIFRNKKVVVMPCLIELGRRSMQIHTEIGRGIGKVADFCIITSKERFEDIKKGAKEAGMKEKNIVLCDNPEEIYSMITLFCKSDDAVLLEGRVPNELLKMLISE